MSAQISRDRKKEKVRELEELHRQLKEQYDRTQLENEKLRQQVEINKQQRYFSPHSATESSPTESHSSSFYWA
jgi:hypothetical protein